MITNLRRLNTKYVLKIVADIENSYAVFLPQWIVRVFEADEELFKNLKKVTTEKQIYSNSIFFVWIKTFVI